MDSLVSPVDHVDHQAVHISQVINRLDGLTYALKKSSRPVAGSVDEQAAMREVYAHAVLGVHPHIVRYYSAWAEEDHMLIQNEHCDGGSLSNKIVENQQQGGIFSESELKDILFQVSKGLEYIHSMGLVHLDMKPGNVFISYGHSRYSGVSRSSEDSSQSGDSNERTDLCTNTLAEEAGISRMSPFGSKLRPTYKIGDMGHVTSAKKPHKVEEGDVRYLALEILQEKYQHIKKADIFSLGLTIFEAGGGGPLPKNGQEWHRTRNNKLGKLERYSADLNNLIHEMVNSDPTNRPSSKELVEHPILCPTEELSVAQLRRELNEEKLKNEVLLKKLEEATRKCSSQPSTKSVDSIRVPGRTKFHRSKSFTEFPSFPLN
ncbi:Wee1-like protein kinase [Oopsacas minuta]|uniref:Wee1-like protein kinase n=1 Tax=Oopsacas minuta TaxID=111878 RepID=A0AAV7KCD8_9METZ|nr:Wee1-like protein kinase [Oopsacas minuta]